MKGWLDKYQEGGVAKTDATRVAAPALKLTKAQLEKNKAINKQVMANTEKANAKKLAERKKGIAESSEADIINPNGKRFAIGDKFRLFPNDVSGYGEVFDNFINPAVFVGNTASGLGNAMIDRDAESFATEAGIALGIGALGFDPLGGAMKAIPNAYKINPWAFKPQEGMMYRGLGEEGAKDAIESGVFRPKQLNYPEKRTFAEIVTSPKQFGSTYYAPAKQFGVVDNYGSGFIAEVPFEGNSFVRRYGRKDWSYKTSKQIPVSEGRLLQKDWLQRYKPIKENGGWLDKYNDGGPVQENYNDYSVSASEGFQGDGYSNVGRNYSPAWGGQFQDGGAVKRFMQPTETFKNYGYNPIEKGMSTEYSTSIGGPGEVYLVPGYRQGKILQDPEGVFNAYGEHLGGPFKTVQAAEDFGKLRHKYVEQNKDIPAPFKTRDYAMGGSIGGATQGIPGATGFMYARTGTIPSNGKYAKKTKASAENGTEMRYYQEGFDFNPKSISEDGSKVIKDDRGQWAHPGEITEIGSNQITMQGVPYPVLGISDTGDMQMMYPDEDYVYDGESVTEIPMMAQGGQLTKLDQLTNFTNYNTKQPGGWLDKYQ